MKTKKSKKQSRKSSIVKKRLKKIDHIVQRGFLSFGVLALGVSILSGAIAVIDSGQYEFAQAQADPDAPVIGGPALPTGGTTTTLSASITNVSVSNDQLIIDFSTTGFTNQINDNHTNFYFNTEPNTVTNKVFFNQSPFSVGINTVPMDATQVCVIVADGSNTIIDNSGNCATLPAITQNAGGDVPIVETPDTPSVSTEAVGIGGALDNNDPVVETVNQETVDQPNAQQQALAAAQQSGETARSGGLAVASGLVLLAIIGYYVYYAKRGDQKSVLKTAEKKIKVKR